MSDATEKSDHSWTRWQKWTAISAAMGIGICVLALAYYLPRRAGQIFTERAVLWNTTDAIDHYLGEYHKWPRDWDALAPSLAFVEPSFRNGDIRAARERVAVNFEVDAVKLPQRGDWYVHLKSNDIPGEENIANERLRIYLFARASRSKTHADR